MFSNIGGKIKTLAKVLCWLGIISWIVFGVHIMANAKNGRDFVFGICFAIIGSFLSWIGSFVLYGFGQLVENSDILVQQNRTRFIGGPAQRYNEAFRPEYTHENNRLKIEVAEPTQDSSSTTICPVCKSRNLIENKLCWNCGVAFRKP